MAEKGRIPRKLA